MKNTIIITQLILGTLFFYQVYNYGHDLIVNRHKLNDGNPLITGIIGFITNFFDTLGIGSYAPTTMLLKLTKSLKNDALLPGTLNVACAIPVMTEAFLYIKTIDVDGVTLLSMMSSAMLGSFIGSKIVARLDEKKIQIAMGCALGVTAILMILSATGVTTKLGANNVATGFYGWKLVIACGVNFILGSLMTAGIGLYAPCMALVYLLGLSPRVAFPIMMSSSASVMPIAAHEFIKKNQYARVPAMAITVCGCVGVFVAITFVKEMNLAFLMWLVIVVMVYTSILMLFQGIRKVHFNNLKGGQKNERD